MPSDPRKYPPGWKQIAHRIKEIANWRCVGCGQMCRRPKESLADFKARVRKWAEEEDAEGLALHALDEILSDIDAKPQRYTLTVAHTPDPTPSNVSDDNLLALCAPCHCRLDNPMHVENARKTRQRKRQERGQLALSEGCNG